MNLPNTAKRTIRSACDGQHVSIRIGRSVNWAGPSGAPIEVVDGDLPPKLVGRPYLKTGFSAANGRFHRILYTPSTRRIQVGAGWLRTHGLL